ncbi:hypothetical protein [Kamptonema formosum]|nr:hypothetical protein [Oscillatoria sp. PCC 10802]
MAIPNEITALIERLNQELERIEWGAAAGLTIARPLLYQFP